MEVLSLDQLTHLADKTWVTPFTASNGRLFYVAVEDESYIEALATIQMFASLTKTTAQQKPARYESVKDALSAQLELELSREEGPSKIFHSAFYEL